MNHRQERLAHELRDRIASILKFRVQDPRLLSITITGVNLSPDLSFARVFFRALEDRDETAQAFLRAKSFIRRQLAEGLRLRRVPELHFQLDSAPEHAARIDQILGDLRRERESDELKGTESNPSEEGSQ